MIQNPKKSTWRYNNGLLANKRKHKILLIFINSITFKGDNLVNRRLQDLETQIYSTVVSNQHVKNILEVNWAGKAYDYFIIKLYFIINL